MVCGREKNEDMLSSQGPLKRSDTRVAVSAPLSTGVRVRKTSLSSIYCFSTPAFSLHFFCFQMACWILPVYLLCPAGTLCKMLPLSRELQQNITQNHCRRWNLVVFISM